MVNDVFVDDKKLKDIFVYISGLKNSEQIRMMFLFSLNGFRSINFRLLQARDCYTSDWKVKDVVILCEDKNKGQHKCSYFLNSQMKKELASYLKFLQNKNKNFSENTYLFTSQKQQKPYNRVSICKIFSSIYKKFGIKASSHLGRHLFISKLINSGVNICLVQKLVNHKNISTTQRYYNFNESMLSKAVENVKI